MNKTFIASITVSAVALALFASGCASGTAAHGRHATAELSPASGSAVHGVVHFHETPNGVHIIAKISGLTPGPHGFHIHENGDCSAPDATSAKGHFNPAMVDHGGPNDAVRHAGDLGNITADASGNASLNVVDKHISFDGPTSIVGRGVIVHAVADDLVSQPVGKAGARVACGVITIH